CCDGAPCRVDAPTFHPTSVLTACLAKTRPSGAAAPMDEDERCAVGSGVRVPGQLAPPILRVVDGLEEGVLGSIGRGVDEKILVLPCRHLERVADDLAAANILDLTGRTIVRVIVVPGHAHGSYAGESVEEQLGDA